MPHYLPFIPAAILATQALVSPAFGVRLSECLQGELAVAAEDSYVSVNIRLRDQLDVAALRPYLTDMTKAERRMTVMRLAKEVALRTQEPLLAHLADFESDGSVLEIKTHWACSELNILATPAVVRDLMRLDGIAYIGFNPTLGEEILTDAGGAILGDELELWNLEMIDAPDAWAQGYEGQGVIIANVDTGVYRTHADFVSRIWENPGEVAGNGVDDDNNGFIDDDWGWDFDNNDNDPGYSGSSHGTNTAGIMVGDGTSGTLTGVAPRGTMMVVKSCSDEFGAREAYEYALEAGADVISSSCSYKIPNCPDYAAFRQLAEIEAAAGLFHTNSIGNQGGYGSYPVPYNISAPAHGPASWLHPDQILRGTPGGVQGCGAVNSSGDVHSWSGEGPAEYESGQPGCGPQYIYDDYPYNPEMGLLKPDYVAPTDVMTTQPFGGYTNSFGGTSAATPHSGGVATVILSAIPDATPAEVSEAMQMTAEDRGTAGKDNRYGAGILDVDDAVNYLLRDATMVITPPAQKIAAGGQATIEMEVHNNSGAPLTVELLGNAYMPNGAPAPNNPVFGPKALTLGTGATLVRGLTGTIRGRTGVYTLEGIVRQGSVISTDTAVIGVH